MRTDNDANEILGRADHRYLGRDLPRGVAHFAVAEVPERSVEAIWKTKVPADVKDELGPDFYDKLVAMPEAARTERESDPDAAANPLNGALS